MLSACYWGSLALAAWAPLPFASGRPWSWGLLGAIVGALVVALALSDLTATSPESLSRRPVVIPATLFALSIAWAIVQCLPWAPKSWLHPLWNEAAIMLPHQAIRPSISIDPAASRTAILRLMTYAGIFWISYRCCRQSARARLMLAWLSGIGAIYAAYGLAIYWSGNQSVLWFAKWAYLDDLTSTFVNRNAYAAFTGLAVLTMVGLLFDIVVREIVWRQGLRGIARSLGDLVTMRFAWLVAALLVSGTALLLTHSRGGAAATAGGILALLVMACLAPSFRSHRRLAFGTAFIIALGALVSLPISGTATLTRVADTSWDLEGRPTIYELTLRAISERPLLGTGLGTFKTVFAAYRTPNLPFLIEFAHNDYLENMLELGIPAALLMFGSVLLLLLTCVRGIMRRRREAIVPCVGVGATVLVGLHSLVDFSLQIPAVTAAYFLLLGAAVAQSIPSAERAGRNEVT